eukprot:1313420-Pyramimonas_sp.AAC.1
MPPPPPPRRQFAELPGIRTMKRWLYINLLYWCIRDAIGEIPSTAAVATLGDELGARGPDEQLDTLLK